LNDPKRAATPRVVCVAMDAQVRVWKLAVERLWTAPMLDYRDAAQLAAEIARHSDEPRLQQVAAQAVANLRGACVQSADRRTKDLARRRFGTVRDVLHNLAGPRFGKRRRVGEMPTPDEHHRQMLGLPLGRRLLGPEIREAYKRTAKKVHPDAGGSERAFLELSAARDALLKAL
jgi:hypothetical protein